MDKKTILFADDDTWFVDAFFEDLKEVGYDVIQATTGSEVLEKITQLDIALLILDIMMPTGDNLHDPSEGQRTGIRVAEEIRTKKLSKVPIIYMTVISDQAVHGLLEMIEKQAGLVPKILVKPVSIEDLIDEVKSCLDNE